MENPIKNPMEKDRDGERGGKRRRLAGGSEMHIITVSEHQQGRSPHG
jgi:hypothetical protein